MYVSSLFVWEINSFVLTQYGDFVTYDRYKCMFWMDENTHRFRDIYNICAYIFLFLS